MDMIRFYPGYQTLDLKKVSNKKDVFNDKSTCYNLSYGTGQSPTIKPILFHRLVEFRA